MRVRGDQDDQGRAELLPSILFRVQRKDFPRALRGYDRESVDRHLERISDRLVEIGLDQDLNGEGGDQSLAVREREALLKEARQEAERIRADASQEGDATRLGQRRAARQKAELEREALDAAAEAADAILTVAVKEAEGAREAALAEAREIREAARREAITFRRAERADPRPGRDAGEQPARRTRGRRFRRRREPEAIVVEGYCVKEKKKTRIESPEPTTLKNGRAAISGHCPDCGSKIVRMGSLDAASSNGLAR